MGIGDTAPPSARTPAPAGVRALSVALAAGGGAAAFAAGQFRDAPASLGPAAAAALMAALVGSGCLQIRFSYRDQFEALDLFDAVLAPAVFFLPGPTAVLLAAAAMGFSEGILRTPPVKAVFNVAQWAAAAAGGSLCFALLARGDEVSARNLAALAAAMGVVSLLNHGAMVAVFTLVSDDAEGGRPSLADGSWLLGGAVNLALGLVLVAAVDTGAWTLVLFAVPLGMLHWASRSYAEGRADRARLAGLQRATHLLVKPIDPRDAIAGFLAEVRACFSVEVAELVLAEPDGGGYRTQRALQTDPAGGRTSSVPADASTLAVQLLRAGVATRVDGQGATPADTLLREEGWRDCLAAPLVSKGAVRGVLCAYNRAGLVSFQAGELPVLEALATELAGALEKAELVDTVLHHALHDALTGLPNRTLFSERLERAIVACRPDVASVAVILLDLNRFKEVNDTLGHHHGDLLLQDFSRRLQAGIRPADTVARLGGDEFTIVIPGVANRAEAEAVVERLLQAVEEPFVVQGLTLDVDVAIGITLYPEHGLDAPTLLQRADVAMYAAKARQSGYEFYEADRDRSSPRRLALVGELRAAPARGEVHLLYQPKADLRTGCITGVEALARWQHPVYGPVSPDEFISIAEQTGSIRILTTFVLREALTQCAAWRAAGLDLGMAVNLSPRSLLDAGLPAEIASLLHDTGVPSAALTLELTETSMMTEPVRTAEVLNRLHGLGLQLSIDDYGTGYSSLAYLRHLPVVEMKIDKSFVMSMDDDTDAAVIVRSTVDLGHNLGLRVVAEGVETASSWNRLVHLGCDAAQGYLISRPMPAAGIELLVSGLHQGV